MTRASVAMEAAAELAGGGASSGAFEYVEDDSDNTDSDNEAEPGAEEYYSDI